MRVLMLTMLMVFSSQAARAEEEEIAITGYGPTSCAKYAESFQENPDTTEQIFTSWALGYISGRNMEEPSRNLAEFSMIDVNRICTREPLELFFGAVERVYRKLPFNKSLEE